MDLHVIKTLTCTTKSVVCSPTLHRTDMQSDHPLGADVG